MGLTIISPRFSFVQLDEDDEVQSCSHPGGSVCLPVYAEDDIAFQFIVRADTEEEADDLCTLDNSGVSVGLSRDGIVADMTFTEKPVRYRLNSLEVLYNWEHGLPGFTSVIGIGVCFKIFVTVGEETVYSNCFNRIHDSCYTSVIEYGAEENLFGFAYCGGLVVAEDEACEPQFISFTNQATLSIPYSVGMQAKYGAIPNVTVWLYNENNELQIQSVAITHDTYPSTMISIDMGGVASGILKIN